tara:strand:+ start:389 stop:607 length:219 start_codon:yes stop_codon:yes gene_type:complete
MAKGGAVKTAAVGIDGADSNGKANDKEMRGDAAAVATVLIKLGCGMVQFFVGYGKASLIKLGCGMVKFFVVW